ncbi:MAG TPA: Flp family type IVb pilin [Acidimicrobiia bacterium]|nr:Flp family type IVb pilin [Acidimicrobiia bacterium]
MDFFVVLHSWLRARFGRDERGANLVEYLLLVSLIAIAVMGAVIFLRNQIIPQFNNAGSAISTAP